MGADEYLITEYGNKYFLLNWYLFMYSVIRYSSAPISTRVKSAIAHRKSQIWPHAPTTHAHFQNLFRTHFRTHIARAEVRFYAHVRRNPTSAYDCHDFHVTPALQKCIFFPQKYQVILIMNISSQNVIDKEEKSSQSKI